MGTPWNGLNRKKRPKQISDKRRAKLANELEVKRVVCRRAGGIPYNSAGTNGIITSVSCEGGVCEVCKNPPCQPTYKLEFHELVFRSAGGVPSEKLTYAVCRLCHDIFQHHLLVDKKACIKFIKATRKISQAKAEQIFRNIKQFYKAHKDNISTKAVSKLKPKSL